jgi:hypothetical protein
MITFLLKDHAKGGYTRQRRTSPLKQLSVKILPYLKLLLILSKLKALCSKLKAQSSMINETHDPQPMTNDQSTIINPK